MGIKMCVGAKLDDHFVGDGITEIIKYPEVSLEYPELIAEMEKIVKSKRELIIITNSPHIINCVGVLAHKNAIICSFINYIGKDTGVDCTDNLESIYSIMLRPWQDLENIRCEE